MTLAGAADTIAAVATAVAAGEGSVAIVRLSGLQAEAIGRQLFRPAGHQQVWDSHRVLYGHVHDPASGECIDEVLLLLMRAPRSFTRETVVEFHGHGGVIAVQRLLELVLAAGARRALPGEFSQRAFLNGRLDLTRA
jgi:tRNA modification GTPase